MMVLYNLANGGEGIFRGTRNHFWHLKVTNLLNSIVNRKIKEKTKGRMMCIRVTILAASKLVLWVMVLLSACDVSQYEISRPVWEA